MKPHRREVTMRLIEEIERCVPAFDYPDEPLIEAITSPEIRALVRRKNGALALSGALVLFGCGGDQRSPLHFSRYQAWAGRTDYGIEPTDDIFGADIFGDLLFARAGAVFRLDGELGEHVRLGDLSSFFDRQLSDIAEELGGKLGREHFAHRVLGLDPLRLLPTLPFMMRQHVRGEFFETPLWRALVLKHRLFVACRDAPNGAEIDCSFWRP
jgi:hypothetical protein